MRLREILVPGAICACLLLLSLPALASHHEAGEGAEEEPAPIAWDAERMTELTADLSKQMRGLRNSFRKSPNYRNPDHPNRRAAEEMADTLKNLDSNCASLAKRVGKGEGADETRGLARRIGSLLNDADVEGRKLMSQAWTDDQLGPAMKTINEIAKFYGREPLYDVDNRSRLDRSPNPNRRQQGE